MKGAIERYNEMKRDIQAGMRDSLYRSGEKIREAKRAKKDWRNTWFLQGVTVSTISCTVTPGSELKKRLNTCVNSEILAGPRLLKMEVCRYTVVSE